MKVLAAASLAKQGGGRQVLASIETHKQNNQIKACLLPNAPDGSKVQVVTTELAPEGAAGPFPPICRVPSVSSAAAEAGDAGGHPWEHAVCREVLHQGKGKGGTVGSTRS